MEYLFDIKKSEKSYLEGKEKYIVVYDNQVMLRVLGKEGAYEIMTATVGEDYGDTQPFMDKEALIEAALALNEIFGVSLNPVEKRDYNDRAYVYICTCEYLSDVYRITDKLIKILNEISVVKKHNKKINQD
jgi:hypothetical protein